VKSAHSQAQVRVDKALAEVPVDNRGERMKLHARLRQKYDELEPLKSSMNNFECACFEEIGEIVESLEKCDGSGAARERRRTAGDSAGS
jgi:hypothetical protein